MIVHWKKVPREWLRCIARNHNLGVRFYLEHEEEIKWWKSKGVEFFRRKENNLWARNFNKEV